MNTHHHLYLCYMYVDLYFIFNIKQSRAVTEIRILKTR
jgi:hypothetical protein